MTVQDVPQTFDMPVALAEPDVRAAFVRRTYTHLLGAVAFFVAILVYLFQADLAYPLAHKLMSMGPLVLFGGFVLVSWLASGMAHRARSPGMQYLALGGFVLAEALFFTPLLVYGVSVAGVGVIQNAAAVTLVGFALLTAVAWQAGREFKFLGVLLRWVGIAAFAGIIASLVLGFTLGLWFDIGMVVFAGGAILWDTGKVLHSYPQDRHVGAALELFASVALLFWYVLRIFIGRR